jgi:putative hemolysin
MGFLQTGRGCAETNYYTAATDHAQKGTESSAAILIHIVSVYNGKDVTGIELKERSLVEIVVLVLLIILNGVFAMSEIAVISSRRGRLQQWADEGNRGAQTALTLTNEPTRFLSTVQIGITLIGTLAGAFGGATLAAQLSSQLARVPALAPYRQPLSFGLVVLSITYLSLVLGELAPKRIAQFNPERIAAVMAPPMSGLARIAAPVVWLLTVSTEAVLRLVHARTADEPPVTEAEINALLTEGTQAGVFEQSEQDLIGGVFRLGDRTVGSLLTPRTEITWLNVDDPAEDNLRKITEAPFSHFPVARGSLDQTLGLTDTRDLYVRSVAGQPFDLTADLRSPLYVPETVSAFGLLERFKQTGIHLALAVDEYGSVQGLITITDLLEAIVGDMPAADEPYQPEIVQRADGSWLADGLMNVADLKEVIGVRELPGENRGDYQTLGGLMMMQLGRIPTAGDAFQWENLRFEVVDMDERRVDKVLIAPTAPDVE